MRIELRRARPERRRTNEADGVFNHPLPESRLLALTSRARRLPHPAGAIALAFLFDVLPLAVLVVVDAADPLPDSLLPSALAQAALFGTVYGLYMLQVCAWVGLWERRPIFTLGLERGRAGRRFVRGAALGIGVYLALLAVLAALGMLDVRSDPSPGAGWAVAVAAVVALGGWAVQGSAEELLYRGWLPPVVAARAGLWWGIAASSTVFALSPDGRNHRPRGVSADKRVAGRRHRGARAPPQAVSVA